jgi:uncharacterized protein (TIRG00374 family)
MAGSSNPQSPRLRRLWVGTAKVGLGLSILATMLWLRRDDLATLRHSQIDFGPLLLGFAFTSAATVATFLRWYILVRAAQLPFRFRDALRLGFVGYFFNLLIPGAVGGDLVKAVLLAREQERRTVAVATVMVDRLIGMIGLVWLAGAVMLIFRTQIAASPELRGIARWVLVVVTVGTLVPFLLLWRRVYGSRAAHWLRKVPMVGRVWMEMSTAMVTYGERWRALLLCVLLSMVCHCAYVTALWCGGLALAKAPPVAAHALVTPLALMAGAVPLTPGGIGVAEAALDQLYTFVGVPAANGLFMMLAFRAMQLVLALIGLWIHLLTPAQVIGREQIEAGHAPLGG